MNESLALAQEQQEIFTDFLGWSGFVAFQDIDSNGTIDIVLQSIERGGVLTIFEQSTDGNFSRIEFETNFADEFNTFEWKVFAMDDFDQNGRSEVVFLIENYASEGSKSFFVQEILF